MSQVLGDIGGGVASHIPGLALVLDDWDCRVTFDVKVTQVEH